LYKIEIYGEIVNSVNLFDSTGINFFHLKKLNEELELAKGQPLLIALNTYGGDVDEGFAIYSALRRYAQENEVEITTRCDGNCASIGTVIFLAGDKRIASPFILPFIHNAWAYAMGDSKELKRIALNLEETSNMIANHYANHTDLTVEEALELMGSDTYLSLEQMIEIRFATEIENISKPKALQRFEPKKQFNKNNMDKKKENILNKILEIFKNEPSIKNLIVYSDTNSEIDFYELNEGDVVKVGDKAKIGDSDANGEVKTASGETYIFENGILLEVKEAEAQASKEVEELKNEIAELKSQLSTINNSLVEITNHNNEFKALRTSLKALANSNNEEQENDEKTPLVKEKIKGIEILNLIKK
jgi:ATP-dependent protease ClpP protease subunit